MSRTDSMSPCRNRAAIKLGWVSSEMLEVPEQNLTSSVFPVLQSSSLEDALAEDIRSSESKVRFCIQKMSPKHVAKRHQSPNLTGSGMRKKIDESYFYMQSLKDSLSNPPRRQSSVPVKSSRYGSLSKRSRYMSESGVDWLKSPLVEDPISVASFGKLTDSKPLKLLSMSNLCTLRITDTSFELLYDKDDYVIPILGKSASSSRLKKKTQYRSPKIWLSGSVTKNLKAFKLHPSKLMVSICGVEQGLLRSTGGLLRLGRSAHSGNSPAGFSYDETMNQTTLDRLPSSASSNNSYVSDISTKTLTQPWFASEGFFLKTTRDDFKRFIEGLLLPYPKDIVKLIWEFLPESKFKDLADLRTLPGWSDEKKTEEDEILFKSFSVIPETQTELTVEDINLEAYVYNNLDASYSSITLSKLNGSFICRDKIDRTWSVSSINDYNSKAKDRISNIKCSGRRTLPRCQSTPTLRTQRSIQDLVRCQSLLMDVVLEENDACVDDYIKDHVPKTFAEINIDMEEKIDISTQNGRGDSISGWNDEMFNFQEVVAPELSPFKRTENNPDFCESLNYSLLDLNPITSPKIQAPLNRVSNQQSFAVHFNNFGARVKNAVADAMWSDENQCRSFKRVVKLSIQKDSSSSSIISSSDKENENITNAISQWENTREEQVPRMIVLLRKETKACDLQPIESSYTIYSESYLKDKQVNSRKGLLPREEDDCHQASYGSENLLVPPDFDFAFNQLSFE